MSFTFNKKVWGWLGLTFPAGEVFLPHCIPCNTCPAPPELGVVGPASEMHLEGLGNRVCSGAAASGTGGTTKVQKPELEPQGAQGAQQDTITAPWAFWSIP